VLAVKLVPVTNHIPIVFSDTVIVVVIDQIEQSFMEFIFGNLIVSVCVPIGILPGVISSEVLIDAHLPFCLRKGIVIIIVPFVIVIDIIKGRIDFFGIQIGIVVGIPLLIFAILSRCGQGYGNQGY